MEDLKYMTNSGAAFRSPLDDSRIDVWHVSSAHVRSAVIPDLYKTLSRQETDRVQRFRTSELSQSFIISRGFLRLILASYVNADPRSVEFVYGSNGKPHLVNTIGLEFNVSHSSGQIVFACGRDCKIGIDIEAIRPMKDLQAVAQMCFTQEELTQLTVASPDAYERAFYLCWTRKEAYLKAIGTGLSLPLQDFQIELDPRQIGRVVLMKPEQRRHLPECTVRNIEVVEDCASALACSDRPRPTSIIAVTAPSDFQNHY
jgi:4'-phosphopantetheinyl transferase